MSSCSRFRTCLSTLLRSEEHTSELQSLAYLVCRLLLEKKNSFFYIGRAFSIAEYSCSLFFSVHRRPYISTLFPYTTLFRSRLEEHVADALAIRGRIGELVVRVAQRRTFGVSLGDELLLALQDLLEHLVEIGRAHV